MAAWVWASVGLILLGATCETFSRVIRREQGGDPRKARWLCVGDPPVDSLLMPEYVFYSFVAMLFVFIGYVVIVSCA